MATKRSNRGIPIDMDALIAKSSKQSPAVGNMRVNANGDVIDSRGNVIQKSEDRVRAYYKGNPKSSTSTASLKEPINKPKLPTVDSEFDVPATTVPKKAKSKATPAQPDEFDAPNGAEPLGYNEVTLPSGDIEMVPYYREEDNDKRN